MDLLDKNKCQILLLSGIAAIIYFAKRLYFAGGVCKSKVRLDGKTVIITGANTGIGKETALDLAKRGARVIMACRDLSRASKAAEEIRKSSGNGNIIVESLDLSSLKSVEAFAHKINSQEARVDILINNAGIMACPHWKTTDEFEMQIGVNHLGHFHLVNLLLDKIKKSSPSRIVNVSSLANEKGRINFDDLNSEKSYDPWIAYRQSKLANVLFTRELAKRLQGTGVTSYALHPGVVRTELGRHFAKGWRYKLFFTMFYPVIWCIFKTSREGAQTTIYCAVAEELRSESGLYYSDCKEKRLLPHALVDREAAKLWKISKEMIQSKIPL